jgi:hypothetical protein
LSSQIQSAVAVDAGFVAGVTLDARAAAARAVALLF